MRNSRFDSTGMNLDCIYAVIMMKCRFPQQGHGVTQCEKCDFFEKQCHPKNGVVGCFSGWTFKESEQK